VRWSLEVSSDLIHWQPVEAVVSVVEPGPESDRVRVLEPDSGPVIRMKFVRLSLELIPPAP
jgi:hypothetical protein